MLDRRRNTPSWQVFFNFSASYQFIGKQNVTEVFAIVFQFGDDIIFHGWFLS